MDKIDARLLSLFDRFVGWNEARGRANQWRMAEAAVDMGFALIIAASVVAIMGNGTEHPIRAVGNALVILLFWWARRAQIRSIKRHEGLRHGAAHARLGEALLRRRNLFINLMLAMLSLINTHLDDVLFLLAIMTYDSCFYLKAAHPVEPERKLEPARAQA